MQDFLPVNKKEMKERGMGTGRLCLRDRAMPTWTILPLVRPLSADCWKAADIRWGSSASRTGERKKVSRYSANPGWDFWLQPEIWIPWSIITLCRRSTDRRIPILREGRWVFVRTGLLVVYSNLIRQTYKHTPIILGGIEASLRRMAHYDYWENKVKHSILIDSGADLISYGMGEHSIIEIAEALESGIPVEEITYIAGTVFKCKDLDRVYEPIILPSYEEVKEDKKDLCGQLCHTISEYGPVQRQDQWRNFTGTRGYVVQNPPALPLSQEEMDDVYALPYTERVSSHV